MEGEVVTPELRAETAYDEQFTPIEDVLRDLVGREEIKRLTELGLIELDLDTPSCRILEAVRSDLELSPTYRASREQLDATERALGPELPQALPAAATG